MKIIEVTMTAKIPVEDDYPELEESIMGRINDYMRQPETNVHWNISWKII